MTPKKAMLGIVKMTEYAQVNPANCKQKNV